MGEPTTNGHSNGGSRDVQDVVRSLSGIKADSFANDGDRIQALAAAYELVARIETPWDFVLRTCMGQVRRGSLIPIPPVTRPEIHVTQPEPDDCPFHNSSLPSEPASRSERTWASTTSGTRAGTSS